MNSVQGKRMSVLLNEVVICHRRSPRSSPCQSTHIPPSYEWNVSSQFSFGFHLLRPIPFCHTPTHRYTPVPHAVRESQSNAKLLFPSVSRLSLFFLTLFGIISVPVASWSFQLPLFQFRLLGASGNNEKVVHGKIISLHSTLTVVPLTHDPGPQPSICSSGVWCWTPSWIYLSLPCNYLLTSPIVMPRPTFGALGQSLIRGAWLACLWLANTEQHWVVCLAGTDTEQSEAFQASGWPWTSVISPSGAAASANSQRIVLTQLPCFIQSNFTLIILNLALAFLPRSGEWDFV